MICTVPGIPYNLNKLQITIIKIDDDIIFSYLAAKSQSIEPNIVVFFLFLLNFQCANRSTPI